jgi:hypothetical protein
MTRVVVSHASSLFAAMLIALAGHSASEANTTPVRKYFVRRSGIVCRQNSDISKVGWAINTMRHFAQIRTLAGEGRCQIYATRRAIIEIGATKPSARIDAIQVRTEDRPNELQWMLRKDLGEIAR